MNEVNDAVWVLLFSLKIKKTESSSIKIIITDKYMDDHTDTYTSTEIT